MGLRFNADEVFTMAVNIEENAAAFYRRAGELQEQSPHVKLFTDLAKMEERHKKMFEEMRAGLAEEFKAEKSYDPDGETELYLAAMADTHSGEGSIQMTEQLSPNDTLGDIISLALKLEKKSILYYIGLRDLVPERLGRDKIDVIIGEEKRHVAQLMKVQASIQ
jgi:rubrerythrin